MYLGQRDFVGGLVTLVQPITFFHVRVFKKASSVGQITVYLGQRDFVGGHVALVQPITFFHVRVFKKASSDRQATDFVDHGTLV